MFGIQSKICILPTESQHTYAINAPKTKSVQEITHKDNRLIEFDTGLWFSTLLNMLVNTRNSVTKRAIRPGTISGGIKKLT